MTPRSTAAVEAAGRRAFGTASAVVTVARMLGMAVGLAILTAYGSTTIDRLYTQVYATPDTVLEAGDLLIVSGPIDDVEAFAERT